MILTPIIFYVGLFFSITSCIEKADPSPTAAANSNGQTSQSGSQGATQLHNPPPCAGCHEKDRPLEPHVASGECDTCHAYPDWLQDLKFFSHDPEPDTCNQCHESDRPPAPHVQSTECGLCHNLFPAKFSELK